MSEEIPKSLPVEQQLKFLRESFHSKHIKLYLDLIKILGKEKGFELWKKLAELYQLEPVAEPLKKAKNIYEVFKAAVPLFDAVGFKMSVERLGDDKVREVESTCPYIEIAKKLQLNDIPCKIICELDVELMNKNKKFRGLVLKEVKIISQIAKGADKCVFEYTGKPEWVTK
jgi:predicted ArsR family transcriptional regulator